MEIFRNILVSIAYVFVYTSVNGLLFLFIHACTLLELTCTVD